MTLPKDIPGPRPEGLKSPEKRLAGKTAIVTGGSRDVGAGIVEAFAAEGVRVVTSFHDEKKQKRVDQVMGRVEALGGDVSFFRNDLSASAGRVEFSTQALEKLDGKVDFLVLNTSGDSPELNEGLSAEMLDRILPHMNDGGTVVRLQSVPGKFAPQLEGLGKMIALYDQVAGLKYKDLKGLRKRQQEMADRGIRFIELTPPVVKVRDADGNVDDTSNMKLFNFAAKREARAKGEEVRTAEEMHNEISDKLGLPRVLHTDEIGARLIDILLDTSIPSGYTEFFNGVTDAQTALETWYGTPDAVGIQTLQRNEFKGIPLGLGRSIVSKEQVGLPRKLSMVDSFERDENGNIVSGTINITTEKSRGHLNSENGFPLIFPGHKQIRAAVETIQEIEREAGNSHFSRLKHLDLAQFTSVALADGTHVLTVVPEVVMRGENDEATYNVKVFDESGKQTSAITNLTVSYTHDQNPEVLPEDFIIEAAAQTAGATLLPSSKVDKGSLPLFGQVGPVDFSGLLLKPGEGVEYYAGGSGTEKGIDGSVVVISGKEHVANIGGIKAVVVPTRVGFRMIGYKPPESS